MKKIIYFFAFLTGSFLFNSCSGDDDGSGSSKSISIGDEVISLKTGATFYYGQDGEEGYNTDLNISSLSKSDVLDLLALEVELEDESITYEEYEEQAAEIIGDQTVSGFYIEAFSDVMEELSVGTYNGPLSTYEAYTYSSAEFYEGDTYYDLEGVFTVIKSSNNYYEVEFIGETTDGLEVNLSFAGTFIHSDYSSDYGFDSKGVKSKKTSKLFLK